MNVNLILGEPTWRTINQRRLVVEGLAAGITVKEFVFELGTRYPKLAEDILGESGELDLHFAIFVNEGQVRWSESETTFLSDNDNVMIMMPLSGG